MGVDLRLLPFDAPMFSHTVLSCERRRDLWEPIERLPSRDVLEEFTSFCGQAVDGETGYGETSETPYGNHLKYTRVSALLSLSKHPAVLDNPKNRAIWAYLAALPPDTKVALYWH